MADENAPPPRSLDEDNLLTPRLAQDTLPQKHNENKENSILKVENCLSKVVAVVQVRASDGSNANVGIEKKLQSMGAKIRRTVSPGCTHLVCNKSASRPQYNRAKTLHLQIVSVLWVEKCLELKQHVEERAFGIQIAVTPSRAAPSMEPRVLMASDMQNRRASLPPDRNSGLPLFKTPLHPASATPQARSSVGSAPATIQTVGSNGKRSAFETPLPRQKRRMLGPPVSSEKDDENAVLSMKSMDEKRERDMIINYRPPLVETSPAAAAAAVKKPVRLQQVVLTGFAKEDYTLLVNSIEHLGGFKVVDSVSPRTSHVLCGGKKRTMNVMKGIAKGCWLLDSSWVWSSLEKGSWLPEKDHQTSNFGEHVRLEKEPETRKPVLEDLKVFLQACEDKAQLEFLVRSLGGTVVSSKSIADLSVGPAVDSKLTTVTTTWLYDSVMKLERVPFDMHLLTTKAHDGSQRRTQSLP